MAEPKFRFAVTHINDPVHEAVSFDVVGFVLRDHVMAAFTRCFRPEFGYTVRLWQYDANRILHDVQW